MLWGKENSIFLDLLCELPIIIIRQIEQMKENKSSPSSTDTQSEISSSRFNIAVVTW